MSEMHRVLVRVKGRQQSGGGVVNVSETTSEGRHYFHRGRHYILYEDKSLAQGAQQTKTVLQISPTALSVTRHGPVDAEHYFKEDEESHTTYRTPYGNMDLSIRTNDLDATYGDVTGTVDVSYDLAVNGRFQSNNTLHIEITTMPGEAGKLN